LAGRAKARQVLASTRLWRLNETVERFSLQNAQQVGHVAVEQWLAGTDDEHAGRIAGLGGMERDALFGQVEVEFGN
jgi:hypothetical protein